MGARMSPARMILPNARVKRTGNSTSQSSPPMSNTLVMLPTWDTSRNPDVSPPPRWPPCAMGYLRSGTRERAGVGLLGCGLDALAALVHTRVTHDLDALVAHADRVVDLVRVRARVVQVVDQAVQRRVREHRHGRGGEHLHVGHLAAHGRLSERERLVRRLAVVVRGFDEVQVEAVHDARHPRDGLVEILAHLPSQACACACMRIWTLI